MNLVLIGSDLIKWSMHFGMILIIECVLNKTEETDHDGVFTFNTGEYFCGDASL